MVKVGACYHLLSPQDGNCKTTLLFFLKVQLDSHGVTSRCCFPLACRKHCVPFPVYLILVYATRLHQKSLVPTGRWTGSVSGHLGVPSMWNWNKGFPSPALLVVLLTPTKLKDFSCGSRQSSLVSNRIIRMVLFSLLTLNISESILKSVKSMCNSYQDFLKTNIKDPNAPRCSRGSEFPRPYKSSVVCPSCTGEWMQCTLGP